jgi:glucose-1-phosphate adenylyltransferase
VVISSGDTVYKMDFNEIIAFHERKEADVTIVYKRASDNEDLKQFGVMELDEYERLTDFEEKPLEPQSDLFSTGVYVISRVLLIKLLEAINTENRYNLVEDVFIRYRKRLRIFGYNFNGYWRTFNSIKSYFDGNMDFLDRDVRRVFTAQFPYIATKPKDEPPAKYNMGANVVNCLAGSGAILNGNARHSVLFRKVFTGENSTINHSIILESCYIGNNCRIEHAILDKEVILSDGKEVIGSPQSPVVIIKGTVL